MILRGIEPLRILRDEVAALAAVLVALLPNLLAALVVPVAT